MTQRNTLLAIAFACLAAVGLAMAGQHVYDMRPCPWCVLQRLIYLVIALVALVGALTTLRLPALSLTLLLTLCGIAAASWQHFVAAKSDSCKLTLADKIVSGLKLDTLLPGWFQVTASCAEAIVDVLGVPFDIWSLTMYVLLAGATLFALRQTS
jgi:protein dithiol:quinone oxidoreductase